MKGIVFVKFTEFVETVYSDDMLDHIILVSDLPSRGAYVSTLLYDDAEIMQLLAALSEKTGTEVADLLIAFGRWVFIHLYQSMPNHEHHFNDVFASLRSVQSVIHVEVKKLNPDVILPEFVFLEETETRLVFEYQSPRNLCRFCEGLILGLSDHAEQKVSVSHRECVHEGDHRCVIEVEKIDG